MRRRIRLTESDLHKIVKESVKRALNEMIGGSSANGWGSNAAGTERTRNQGGPFGSSPLDDIDDERYFEANRRARLEAEEQRRRRGW